MICTRCQAPIRPVVAIDIDGTLAKYHDHFISFANVYWNTKWPLGAYDGSEEMHEWMNLTLEMYRETKLAYRQGGGKRSIPLYEGARRFMKDLYAFDVEIWLTTTRPYLRLDSTDPDTRFWLTQNGLHFDFLLYSEDKYKELYERVDPLRVVAICDDLPGQLEAAATMFGMKIPIQVINISNLGNRWAGMKCNLEEAILEIQERIQKWHAQMTN